MELQDDSKKIAVEQRIVFLMATNTTFLSELVSKYTQGLFENKYHNIIAKWVVVYYNKKKEAPNDKLGRMFENLRASAKISAEDYAEITVIIGSFASESAVTDVEFELDSAFEYLSKSSLEMACEIAASLSKEGKLDEARELLASVDTYNRVTVSGKDAGSYSVEEINKALNETDEQLIVLPHYLGIIMNDTLVRGGFITLMGVGKVGKSWWLMLMARMARMQNRRTIYITMGDLTKSQALRRVWQGYAQTVTSDKYLDKQYVPCFDCSANQKGTCYKVERDGDGHLLDEHGEVPAMPVIFQHNKDYKPCNKMAKEACRNDLNCKSVITYRKIRRPVLSAELIDSANEKLKEKAPEGALVVEHVPSGTCSIAQRRDIVRQVCKSQGWDHPDVLIYDYLNISKKEDKDKQEAINMMWQSGRADADLFNCLVITANHANRQGLDGEDLTTDNVALDVRILNEVSAIFALNQNVEEHAKNVWRVAAMMKREADYDPRQQAECYGCLALGTPHIISKEVWRPLPVRQYKK